MLPKGIKYFTFKKHFYTNSEYQLLYLNIKLQLKCWNQTSCIAEFCSRTQSLWLLISYFVASVPVPGTAKLL